MVVAWLPLKVSSSFTVDIGFSVKAVEKVMWLMNLLYRIQIKVFKISVNWLVLFSITWGYYTTALTKEGGHWSISTHWVFNSFQIKWAELAHSHLWHSIRLSQIILFAMQKNVYHKLLHKQRWEDGNFWQKEVTDHCGKSHFPLLGQECFSTKSKQVEHYLLCKSN